MSLGCRPASSSGARQGRAAQFDRVLDEKVVGFVEVAQRQVLIHRKDEVPAVDLRAGVQAAHDLLVSGEAGNLDERVGDLILAVPVRGNNSVYACNNTRLLRHEARAGRFDLAAVRFLGCARLAVAETETSVHRPTTGVPTNSIGP